MTGAPKLRSVQLLDELENNIPRGVYSGCLGYISLHDGATGGGGSRRGGTAKFNVVIRTVVIKDGRGIYLIYNIGFHFLPNLPNTLII